MPKRPRPQSRVRTASWALAERLRVDVGASVETHDSGLSLDDLQRRYASPGGGPDADGFRQFCAELFGITLTSQQLHGAEDLSAGGRVLIVGGNGLGKDTLAGAWSLYEAYVLDALVLVTAPSDRQVKAIMMQREIGGRWRHSAERLPGDLLDRGIRIPGHEETGLLAFTSNDPDTFQGHHAARVAIVATEGQGIDRPIFDAMRRCHPKLTLVTCNPTSVLSPVFQFAQSSAWTTQHWSALDHPNVVTGTVVVPGAVTRDEVDEIRRTDGEASRFWQESILGVWVHEVEDALVDPEHVRAATDPERGRAAAAAVVHLDPPNVERGTVSTVTGRYDVSRPDAVSVGIDPAGSGKDYTGVAVVVQRARPGEVDYLVWSLHRYREPDSLANAEACTVLLGTLVREQRLPVQEVICDETSLNAVLAPLKRLVPGKVQWTRPVYAHPWYDLRTYTPTVRGFNASWQALASARFVNLRTQAYVELGERIREGRLVFGPGCEPGLVQAVTQELLAHRVQRTGEAKWELTPKKEVRALLGRSPDLSDALTMAFLPWLTREKPELAPHRRRRVVFR